MDINWVKSIEHINFKQLYRLTLRNNKIVSIEALAFLEMDNLSYLSL